MKYIRVEKVDDKATVLSFDQAKELLSQNYTEKVSTFDEMLSEPGIYPCMYCHLIVEAD